MNLVLLPRKAAEFAGLALALLAIFIGMRQVGLYAWTRQEAEGISILIQLVGDIYAVLLAFMIFVIWTQFTEVENCVTHEANSLQELLRYSSFLNDDARAALRKAVAGYVRQASGSEWDELGEGRKEKQAGDAFARIAAAAHAVTPKDQNLLDLVRTASRSRDERVAKSLTRMPPTLSGLVKLIAAVLLLLIVFYPFHQTVAGAICILIAALVLFVADFVMNDTDNPLKGVWNVRPDAFTELPH